MSLDLSLNVQVKNINITHNLGTMASHVPAGSVKIYSGPEEYEYKEVSLYDVLWRPEEQYLYYAVDLLPYYKKGLEELIKDPEHYKQYNPENGWGSYDRLVEQMYKLISSCEIHKDAHISADR